MNTYKIPSPTMANSYAKYAKQAFREGRYADAIRLLGEAAQADPARAELFAKRRAEAGQ